MDNNGQAAQGQIENGGEVAMDAGDWRDHLHFDSRMRIVNKIMGTLTRHLHIYEQEVLLEIWRISVRFEEKMFTEATNQSIYLRRISVKMLVLEINSHGLLQSNEVKSEENIRDQVIDTQDWKDNLPADSRQQMVNLMMATLTRHLPYAEPEALQELRRISLRLEDKVYTTATSQPDYLRKIAIKMLRFQMEYPLQTNGGSTGPNLSDQGNYNPGSS